MRKSVLFVVATGAVVCTAILAPASVLVVTDTTHKSLMLFNGDNGALINSSYLNMSAQDCGNPISAKIVSPNEFWVTDKSNDQILRYALATNAYLGNITSTSISTPAGIEVVNDTAYVAIISTKKVLMLNVYTHGITGSFAAGSNGQGIPYDVEAFNASQLLVDDYSPAHDIDIFSLTGTFLQTFHDSTGSGDINSPQQISVTAAGTVLAAGSVSPRGIYEYDRFGNTIGYWSRSTGVRGVYGLGNGDILFTDSNGVHSLNRASGQVTDIVTGISANYIEAFVPEPACVVLLAVVGPVIFRRR